MKSTLVCYHILIDGVVLTWEERTYIRILRFPLGSLFKVF
jgi:hypothetical protein